VNYRSYDPDQEYLLPADLREVIPEGDLVYVVDSVVRKLDLSAFHRHYSEEGNPAYHPGMMLKIMFYAYSIGLRSSRKISRAVQTDVRFMYLAARQQPDFHTIARFRQIFLSEIGELFVQIVGVCHQLGIVRFAGLAVDGTKIRANASKRSFKDRKKLQRYLGEVRQRMEEVLREAEGADREENKRFGDKGNGDSLPKEFRSLRELEGRIESALEMIEVEGHRRATATDADAVFMKGDGGQLNVNYNCQAAVDMDSRIVLSAAVSNEAADNHLLTEVVERAEENIGADVDKVVADCGYYSVETDEYFKRRDTDLYLPHSDGGKGTRFNAGYYSLEDFAIDEVSGVVRCPAGVAMRPMQKRGKMIVYRGVGCEECQLRRKCTTGKYRTVWVRPNLSYRKEMQEKLKTLKGQEMMRRRATSVELVFGWIKHIYGVRRFLLRGLEKVNAEWNLILIGHNLRRIGAAIT
jgi:transposase